MILVHKRSEELQCRTTPSARYLLYHCVNVGTHVDQRRTARCYRWYESSLAYQRKVHNHFVPSIGWPSKHLLQNRFRCCQFFRGSSSLRCWIPQKNSATFTWTSSKSSLLLCCDDKDTMTVTTQKKNWKIKND